MLSFDVLLQDVLGKQVKEEPEPAPGPSSQGNL